MPSSRSARPSGRGSGDDGAGAETARKIRTLVDRLPAILYMSEAGVEGRWHYVSPGIATLLGFTPEEWMDDPNLWARQVLPEDRERVFSREADLGEPEVPDEYRLRHRDGSVVWVRDEAALIADPDRGACWHGVIFDITDRKLAEAETARRGEQQAVVATLGKRALEGAPLTELMDEALADAKSVLGVESGGILEIADGAVHLAPRAGDPPPAELARACGSLLEDVSEPTAEGPAVVSVEGPDGRQGPRAGRSASLGLTARIDGRKSAWGVLWFAGASASGRVDADVDFVQALANVLAEAIRQRSSEEHIRYQATHDPLTNLPNRTLFLERLAKALARPEAQLAVVLLDIDNFKLVNDSLGHDAGDELLMAIAPRLSTALRPGDTIGRLGGDEFVVLLDGVSSRRAAKRIAERIVEAFELPFDLRAGEHFAKASLGIAIASAGTTAPASLIRDADAAMYRAKAHGRGGYELFDRAMRLRTIRRLSLENDLRRALERDELRVAYQPIVSLGDGAITSVEALLRWQHPRQGLLPPGEFIPVAEESGLIEPIGRWVLQTACEQAARWQPADPGARPLGISVNLSARQFTRRQIDATVVDILAASGLAPARLCLEITESVLLDEPQSARDTMASLSTRGVRFVLDDFGTGYSSLAYLSRLPIDGLKVDRSFVTALGSDERSTAIVSAIVNMAHALSVEVTAEGVETELQAGALRGLRCELAQGYHFHRPVTAAAVSKLLDGQRRARAPRTPRDPPRERRTYAQRTRA